MIQAGPECPLEEVAQGAGPAFGSWDTDMDQMKETSQA